MDRFPEPSHVSNPAPDLEYPTRQDVEKTTAQLAAKYTTQIEADLIALYGRGCIKANEIGPGLDFALTEALYEYRQGRPDEDAEPDDGVDVERD